MRVVWQILIHLQVGEMAGDSGALARTLLACKTLFHAFLPELARIEYAHGGLSAVETELEHRYIEELEMEAIMRDIQSPSGGSDDS